MESTPKKINVPETTGVKLDDLIRNIGLSVQLEWSDCTMSYFIMLVKISLLLVILCLCHKKPC